MWLWRVRPNLGLGRIVDLMGAAASPVPVWATWMIDVSNRFFLLLAQFARRRSVQLVTCWLLLVLVVLSPRWRLGLVSAPVLLAVAVLGVAPLLTLRRWPGASIALILTANSLFVVFARLAWPMPNVFAWLAAIMAAPLLLPRRWAVLALWFTEVVVVTAVFVPASVNATPWDATVSGFLAVLLFWTVGSRLRQREAAGRERAQMVARVQELEVSDAVSRGRVDMARELHDVVAHHVSLIAVQAATARYSIAGLPPAGGQAFDDIAEQARTALTELRTVLGVLRTAETAAPQRPAPSLADIADLVARTRATHVQVELSVTGRPAPSSGAGRVDRLPHRPGGVDECRAARTRRCDRGRGGPPRRRRRDHRAQRTRWTGGRVSRCGAGIRIDRDAGAGGCARRPPDDGPRPRRWVPGLSGAAFGRRPEPCVRPSRSAPARPVMTEPLCSPLRVLIADDQAVVRLGFAALLASQPDLLVVGAVGDGRAAVQQARTERADLVLMDIRMPILGGIEATAQLQQLDPTPKVIVLTTFDLDDYIYDALRAGASGFLLKDATPAHILEAIRVVAAGDALLDPGVTRRVIEQFADRPRLTPAAGLSTLTAREHEIFMLLARGRSNAEIAVALHLAEQTVKTHVSAVLSKLAIRDRVQAVVLAYESGMVIPGS